MLKQRWILAIILLLVPATCSPQAARHSATSATTRRLAHEPLQITILFRRYSGGKRVTDRSYTLLATTGESLPAIRDDESYRTSPADAKDALPHNIDVDILGLRRTGNSIYIALRISTQNFVVDDPQGASGFRAVTSTHQFLVTPTIPIGKLETVYEAAQPLHDHRDEIQLEVQLFDSDQPAPQ